VLAGGAEQPRDLNVPGRELKGIHFAMEFLPQQNRRNLGDTIEPEQKFWRPASAWSSSEAAIPAPIASEPAIGKAALRAPVRDHAEASRRALAADAVAAVADATAHEGAHEEGGVRDWSIATTKFTGSECRSGSATARRARRAGAKVRADSGH
jgi:glutamate synthase (NADPH) small chain